jgi:hypothetical protein
MSKRFIFSVLFVYSFLLSHTQEKKEKTTLKRGAVSFSTGIIPIPGTPLSLNPGIEIFFTPRISLLNEIALQTGKNKDKDSTAINKRYFKYKAEVRYYFFADEDNAVTPFLGLQFTTAGRKFDISKSSEYYETFQDDSVYTFSRASVSSPVSTLTLQAGAIARVATNFYLEASTGFGIRNINTTYSSVVNLQKVRNVGFFNIKPVSSYRYIGQATRWQLNFGMRIIYRF